MATELPQPGVEVVQEFTSAAPTVVTPTLVPCNIAPFFEVIEALNADGTTNTDATLATLYEQLETTVLQSSFPSPRSNIDEVDVLEETIRCFFDFGGTLTELSDESAFLRSYLDPDVATKPYVDGTTTEASTTGGYDIDGRTLILCIDSHTALPITASALPTSANITITFAASTPGGRLTLDEVIAQINALLPGVASENSDALRLSSTTYGAHASICVRAGGSANGVTDGLGFPTADDFIAVGSGFYAVDDADGDLQSPRLQVYTGSQEVQVGSYPGTAQVTAPNFVTDGLEAGDDVVANGVSIGQIATVESDQLTMEVEQNIMSHGTPFAPRRVWVQANNLVYPAPAASEAATLTGTVQTAAATVPWVIPQSAFVGTASPSESLTVDIALSDGSTASVDFTSGYGGGDWTTLSNAYSAMNSQATANSWDVEPYYSNAYGDEVDSGVADRLGFRLKAGNDYTTGSGASLTISASTVATELGFTTLPIGDVGENIRYLPGTPADGTGGAVSAAPVSSAGSGLTVIVLTNLGTETITWGIGLSTLALVIADWNSQAQYTEAYEANASGVETVGGTYFAIRTIGENVGASATLTNNTGTDSTTLPATFAAVGTDTGLNGTDFKWSIDGNPKVYSVIFTADEDDGGTSLQHILNKINAETPNVAAASSDSPPYLKLTSQKVGSSSQILIGDGTANTVLGFTTAQEDLGAGRPAPDFAVRSTDGAAIIQGQILRDGLTATPYDTGFASIVLQYKGLRLDLSPDADNPSLLVFDDIDTLESEAGPISTDNPGALMTYFSLLNAPTVSCAAIGVPAVSADAPEGTPLGYAKCAEFLENEEVYALATASQSSVVHQTFLTHTNVMSEPEQKAERIYFFNPVTPTRDNPTLVGSGTDLNTTATQGEATLDVNIAPALIANGIDPNSDLNPTTGAIENEVYLDIGDDDNLYLIQKVESGTKLTLRTTFATGDGNDDSFFSSDAFPTTIISDDWTVYIRGDALVTSTGAQDRPAVAQTIQTAAAAYGFRRGFYVFPDQCAINVSGLEQVVEGYYATGCIVGMVAEQPPQQGFTNFPLTGLTRVVGSNKTFTKTHLSTMAAGGVYILIQEADGAPVTCRHQLSTDTSSIESRELSITKVVDYTAKFLRAGLRTFIGRSNITRGFIDNLAAVIRGQLNFLIDGGVLIGADVNNIIQDADNPDTILVDVTLDVPYPANYIRLTLVV